MKVKYKKLTKREQSVIEEMEALHIKGYASTHLEDRRQALEDFLAMARQHPKLVDYIHGAAEFQPHRRRRIRRLLEELRDVTGHAPYAQDRNYLFDLSEALLKAFDSGMVVEAMHVVEREAIQARRSAEAYREIMKMIGRKYFEEE